MSSHTKKQRKVKANFNLSALEREMIKELIELLEMFEFVPNEFQSNKVSISRVYPCVRYLQNNLLHVDRTFVHTDQLRKNLLQSLTKRFGFLIESDVFIVSTFLDINFGMDAFEPDKKHEIKALIKKLIWNLIKVQDVIHSIEKI